MSRWVAIVGALVVVVGCSSSPAKSPASTSSASNVKYTNLDLGIPAAALNAPITGSVPASQVLHVDVTLKVSDAELNRLGKTSSAPPTAKALASDLGITPQEMAQIKQYFASAHVKAKPDKTNTDVTLDVAAGTAGKLLKTKFVTHKLNGRTYFTPDPSEPPKVPVQVAGYILAVTGLDDYSVTPKTGVSAASDAGVPPAPAGVPKTGAAGNCLNFYPYMATPPKVAKAYGYDKLWAQGYRGQGMTVNLVEMDGYNLSDIRNYSSCFGSNGTIQNINMGSPNLPVEGEAPMDIELVETLAPAARIVDYQEDPTQNGSWTALNATLQAIIDRNAGNRSGSVVSVSIGGSEWGLTTSILASISQSVRILTQAEHMTVFFSSGDCGAYSDGWWGHPNVDFPASASYAVGTGATHMAFSPGGARTGESVWEGWPNTRPCRNTWGSGGGVSMIYGRPYWQQGKGVLDKYSNGHREVPDVSAAGIDIPAFYNGQWRSSGGTSAAAPIWAAGMALVNQKLIRLQRHFFFGPSLFYYIGQHPAGSPFLNVSRGNNQYYPATPGYDLATGLGTPYAPNIYASLARIKL